VLLEDTRPDTRQYRILSHRRFDKVPYYITAEVANNQCGPAYRLVHVETGKPHKNLVNGDRLKPYFKDRSGLFIKEQKKQETEKTTCHRGAKRIIKQNGKYRVGQKIGPFFEVHNSFIQ